MDILLMCPANNATGGTESIHNLAHNLNKLGANAKILYTGRDLSNPQPEVFKKYNVSYITEYPADFKGCVIFPEVYANRILEPQFKNIIAVVNWLGVDVYDWNNPVAKRGLYLQRRDAIHIANSEYAMQTLRSRGLNPVRMWQVLNDDFYNVLDNYNVLDKPNCKRSNIVLFNPVHAKMTALQEEVMRIATLKGITFLPIEGYTRQGVIDLFQHSKLYLDLGVFSGRERLPREAVMCGCCIITSNKGAAKDYKDNSIPDKYKVDSVSDALNMIEYVLDNYATCVSDFEEYRQLQKHDKENYLIGVKELYAKILNHNTSL